MKRTIAVAVLFAGLVMTARATTFYVSATSGNDTNSGLSWAESKQTIQAGVDTASDGDIVLVTNGVYASGGRSASGELLTNRVVLNKPVVLRSVNGPSNTIIQGAWHPSTIFGNAAVRCVWMDKGASLIGFTLTNGATRNNGIYPDEFGGGVFAPTNGLTVISNCVITGNATAFEGGGSYGGIFYNCTLTANAAVSSGSGGYGGGAARGTLTDCIITGNSADDNGGGVYHGILTGCILSNNSAAIGGGALLSTLTNCYLVDNSADGFGGGAAGGILNSCALQGNTADEFGGGAFAATLVNCSLFGNTALGGGGGAAGFIDENPDDLSYLINCTVSGNTAPVGAGVFGGILTNCIVYLNLNTNGSVDNYIASEFTYSCTAPLAPGEGNITNDPQFVDAVNSNFQLSAVSPCRDTGNNASAPTGPDLAGNPRIVHGYVDMGAYEHQGGAGQADYDADGVGNGDERVAGTSFTDRGDFFVLEPGTNGPSGAYSFSTVSGRYYAVDCTDDLAAEPVLWVTVTNLGFQAAAALFDWFDPDPFSPSLVYRVRVGLEPLPDLPLYLVIDLSGGPSATNYPVSYLADVPPGGWTEEYKTTKLVLRRIPAGTFTMGSPTNELGRFIIDEIEHEVTISQPFYMGVFEVTQEQWYRVMGNYQSYFNNFTYRDSRPVELVSYNSIRGSTAGAGWPASSAVDPDSFMGKLRARTGAAFDLPTESQWEYAGRAGTTTALNSGQNLTIPSPNPDPSMDAVGRYRNNGGYIGGITFPGPDVSTTNGSARVGSYQPNAWGLYDIHGNVWEWCLDWYGAYPAGPVVDPVGENSPSSLRVIRGGSWDNFASQCRAARRLFTDAPSDIERYIGFRVALPPGQ